MKGVRASIGAAVFVVGLLIALGPFISVWRVGGQALGELPDLEGVDHSDQRVGPSAMFDDEFVVARRTYSRVDRHVVSGALVASGFDGLSKACCGHYDGILADVQSLGADGVLVELTAADSDWQSTWPLFSGFGSLVGVVGLGVLLTGRSTETSADSSSPHYIG